MPRSSPDSGIAIGPILFVIALLGVLAMAMSASSGGGFSTIAVADRVSADVVSQANLIRTKIGECQMQYIVNGVDNSSYPCYGSGSCPAACLNDPYPCSDQTGGTPVSALTCPGDPLANGAQQNVWTGVRPASLPPATKGFNNWYYMDAGNAGGRCIWTSPTDGNGNQGNVVGLTNSSKKFSSQELSYQAGSGSQKFVIMITPPTGTVNPNCAVP